MSHATFAAPAVNARPFGHGIGIDADPMPATVWEWARWTTRRWDNATPGQRAAALAVLGGHKAHWEATPAPIDADLVASPVRFAEPAPAPAPAAEPFPCFPDQLADAVYVRRPQFDRSAKVRGYSDADAAWWAAEVDARDKAAEAAQIEARHQQSRMQEAADAGLWYDPEMEMFDHGRMQEAAECGVRI